MTSLSDILFPSQEASVPNSNINRILGDLKRSNLSIANRLRSIQQDAGFVEEVRRAFGQRPLVANERCGSWYIRPEAKGGSAYFKSTDGHTGQWKFSTRRLNLHLLPMVEKFDGIIIVDSTRRGKRMPDALSKTIPIWCCVLNRALFSDPASPAHHDLFVPPNAVSASEKSQMLARVPEGLDAFRQLRLDLDALRAHISKPLRPTWVTQQQDKTDPSHYYHHDDIDDGGGGGEGPSVQRIFLDFHPVICCTSSKRVTDGEMSGHTAYIQGAGDDTENWAHGLTPPVFWAHADELLTTHEAELPYLIKRLVAAAAASSHLPSGPPSLTTTTTAGAAGGDDDLLLPTTVRRLTPYIYVSPIPIPLELQEENNNMTTTSSSSWCRISLLSTVTPPETWTQSPTQLNVGLGKHKAASRNLRVALANICDFVTQYLQQQQLPPLPPSSGPSPQENLGGQQQHYHQKRIIIACETGGRDLSIGVALALLCRCFADDEGRVPLVVPPDTCKNNNTDTRNSITAATRTTTTTTTVMTGENNNNEGNNYEKTKLSSSSSFAPPPPPPPPTIPSFNKTMIKIRLGRIMTAMPDANPNRATLQSVNSFLMDWRK